MVLGPSPLDAVRPSGRDIATVTRNRTTPRAWFAAALLAAALSAAPLAGSDTGRGQPAVAVPGGLDAVSRLLGYVDTNPETFLASLNRVLLASTEQKHNWKEVPARRELMEYLRVVEELRREYGATIQLSSATRTDRKRFRKLAKRLGYKVRGRGDRATLTPRKDEEDALRRRVAGALGWDLSAVAVTLADGEAATLELPTESVPAGPRFGWWSEALGEPVGTHEALPTLIRDQRLGLVLAGLDQAGPSAAEFLRDTVGLHWLYEKAPFELFRYATALEVRDDRLLAPGGPEAGPLWSSLVGEAYGSTEFVKRLFKRRNGRLIYLWKAMQLAPTEQQRYYLGLGSGSAGGRREFLDDLFVRLDNASMRGFDMARGETEDFATLVRSLPLRRGREPVEVHSTAPEGDFRLDLPGGPGIWYQALKGNRPAEDQARLARAARRGARRDLSEEEFLLRVLTEKTDLGPIKVPILERLLRTANLFLDQTELLTPSNIVAISRAVERYPGAFGILDTFPFHDPSTVAHYMLAVDHLSSLPTGVEQEQLLTQFQGGVEWIGLLAKAGRDDPAFLEERLREWSRLHRNAQAPDTAAPDQLQWLGELLGGLPQVTDSAVGRGPLERRWLFAMVPPGEAAPFEWAGLDYVGHRRQALLDGMARHLERQGVPSADDLLHVAERLDALAEATEMRDAAEARRLSEEAREIVGGWPEPGLTAAELPDQLPQRVLPLDRDDLMQLLNRARSRRGRRLSWLSNDFEAAPALLARELRLVLLAPIYVAAMGATDSLLFNDPDLIRKHLVSADLKPHENVWARAQMRREPPLGFHLEGALSSVPFTLASFRLEEAVGAGGTAAARTLPRYWYEDLISSPWHRVTPQLSRLVSVLVEAGAELTERAITELDSGGGPSLEAVAARVPFARLERHAASPETAAGLSPSERLLIGLGVAAGDDWGAAQPELLSDQTRQALERSTDSLGPEWRRQFDLVGASTPAMNGRGRRQLAAWPPYEALDKQLTDSALQQRELLDLRVVLITAMGRERLPGLVGADLYRGLLTRAAEELRLESIHDWQSFVRWVNRLNESDFQSLFRECLEQGLYSLAS